MFGAGAAPSGAQASAAAAAGRTPRTTVVRRQPRGSTSAEAIAGPPSVATATMIIMPLTALPAEWSPARAASSAWTVGGTPAAAAPSRARATTTTAADGASARGTPDAASADSDTASAAPARRRSAARPQSGNASAKAAQKGTTSAPGSTPDTTAPEIDAMKSAVRYAARVAR